MKKIYLLSSLALATALTSCYDLNTEPIGGVLTEDQREEIFNTDPESIYALSAGIYNVYNSFEQSYGDNFDFGYPSIMLQLDCRLADFVGTKPDLYGWFAQPVMYTDNYAGSPYTLVRWRMPYNVIYSSNQVLIHIPEDTEDDLLKYYRGQAYGNRAFAYWILAQLFQFNYVGHENDLCVPIIPEENSVDLISEGVPRATVQEVYDQILSDLNTGIELMTDNSSAVRADKRYLDLNVLYGIRARTYLCMQEYQKAAADAKTVIDSKKFTPLSSQEAIGPGFIDLNASNWMWGLYYTTETNYGLYTLAGFMGSYCYGYASVGEYKLINNLLFNQIDDNDPRKLWWISPSGQSNAQYYDSANKDAVAYIQSSGIPDYAVVKFAPYDNVLGQTVNLGSVPLMRIEEMYLIYAEALGMGGNLAEGKAALESFVNGYRWLDRKNPWSSSATSADSFLEEVLFQRRIEFWGEGMGYYDVMRLNLGIDRRLSSVWYDPTNRVSDFAYYIAPGSNILLSQLPTSEIENNPQITENNPTGSASL